MSFAPSYELHESPYRHYKATNPETGKVTWNGAGGVRIHSVTDVLDGGADALTQWAIGNTLVAAEKVAVDFLGAGPDLARSILDFGCMAELTGCMPYTIRDDKAALGTRSHHYFAAALLPHVNVGALDFDDIPYAYRAAIRDWILDMTPAVMRDEKGPRVERAVGDFVLAVAGTYDAQLAIGNGAACTIDRVDLKTSRSVQPKHFAQVAAYERCAQLCGEEPSDRVAILHIDPLHGARYLPIKVDGPDYVRALGVFDSYLAVRRGEAQLAKLLKS